jgi:hypothetical protein
VVEDMARAPTCEKHASAFSSHTLAMIAGFPIATAESHRYGLRQLEESERPRLYMTTMFNGEADMLEIVL